MQYIVLQTNLPPTVSFFLFLAAVFMGLIQWVCIGPSDYLGTVGSLPTRAPIDRPISRESSASPNLVGDRSAHPV